MDMMVQMSDTPVWKKDPTWGRDRGWWSCSWTKTQLEDIYNQDVIYPYTVQPSHFPSSLHHPSGVVFSWALIDIPLLCFTILSFSSQINLNQSSVPSFAIILSVCTPQIFSCTKDGRNTHASVIQYHFQSHFEDSYEQAGRQAIEWWSSSQPVTTNCAALNQTNKKKKQNHIVNLKLLQILSICTF